MTTKTITLTQEQIDTIVETLHEENQADHAVIDEGYYGESVVEELQDSIKAREDIMYALTSA